MKYMLLALSPIFMIAGMLTIIYVFAPTPDEQPPASVVAYCIQDAQKAAAEHSGDQFKDRPFYQYCIDNTWKISPIRTRQQIITSLKGNL